jgi:hypothetical protein
VAFAEVDARVIQENAFDESMRMVLPFVSAVLDREDRSSVERSRRNDP